MTKPQYKVIRWSDDVTEEIWEAPQKPTFQEMYKLINCTTIERLSGYDKEISNRTFDMWCDEESKLKGPEFIKKNERATNAWYKDMIYLSYRDLPNEYYFKNDLLGQRISISREQYQDQNFIKPNSKE